MLGIDVGVCQNLGYLVAGPLVRPIWDLYWAPPILGNFHTSTTTYQWAQGVQFAAHCKGFRAGLCWSIEGTDTAVVPFLPFVLCLLLQLNGKGYHYSSGVTGEPSFKPCEHPKHTGGGGLTILF